MTRRPRTPRAVPPGLAGALALLAVLAGCVGGSKPATIAPEGPTVTLGHTTGAIAGYVTDDEINPLPGANVTLRRFTGEFVATLFADAGGAFGFSELEPGRYNVTAKATARETMSQVVDVAADRITEVRFAMPLISVTYRWVAAAQYTGNLTLGTPVGGHGHYEGLDRATFKYPVVGKTPEGEFALCTMLKVSVRSLTQTSVDIDLYVLDNKSRALAQSATGSPHEATSYAKPLAAQNITVIIHQFLGAQTQFVVKVEAEYAVGFAAKLILNKQPT